MNAEKLLKLASFLDTLPPGRFDYSVWASDTTLSTDCGTQGCAMGWATVVFPEELELRLFIDMCDTRQSVVCLKGAPTPTNTFGPAMEAARQVFDIDDRDFDYLFTPQNFECYEVDCDNEEDCGGHSEDDFSAAEVAAKIRTFVEENS
jgi:hypothetical protein